MTRTDTAEFDRIALRALQRADFSPVAQVQSVWSDPPFVDPNLHCAERERILSAFATATEHDNGGPLDHPHNPLIAVYTGVAGAGKTQFLGQMRKALIAPRTQFILVDMTGVNEFQPTVCLHMILSLLKPDGNNQLQQILARIYQIVYSRDLEADVLKDLVAAAAHDFDAVADGVIGGFRARFEGSPLVLAQDSRKHVLRALLMLGLLSDERFDVAYDWLQGAELEKPVAERFRLPVHAETLDIIKSISWFMGFRGKSVLAFDQIDVIVSQFETASRGSDANTAAAAEAIVKKIAGGLSDLWEQAYRTQILVSCLQQTWVTLKARMQESVMDRFWRHPAVLGDILDANVARNIVERRLRPAHGDFAPPYPSYPFSEGFFEAGITPRTLLQRCAAHRDECVRLGRVIEAGSPKRDLTLRDQGQATIDEQSARKILDDEFARRSNEAVVESLWQDSDAAEEQLGESLINACELLLLEAPPPDHIDAKMGRERDPSRKARSALHSRLSLTFMDQADREEFFCFRAIQRMNAVAFQSRLKAAITDSGINLGLKFRRLVILRTQPVPTGAKTSELVALLKSNGGSILSIETSELKALQTLTAMKKKGDPDFEPWLRSRRPLTSLRFVQEAFLDYFRLTQPAGEIKRPPQPAAPPDKSSPLKTAPPESPDTAHQEGAAARDPKSTAPGAPASVRQDSLIIGRSAGPFGQKILELPLTALTQHVLIRAGSGGGKTVLLKRLIEAAAIEGVPSIVLDPGNDLAYLGDSWPTPPPEWLPDDQARAETYFQRTQVVVWTPGRASGRPLAFSPLPSFAEVIDDPDDFEAAVQMAVGSLYEPTGASKGTSAEMKKGLLAEAIRHFARGGGQTLPRLVEFLRELPPEAKAGIDKASKLARDMADTLQASLLRSKTLSSEDGAIDLSQLLGIGEPKTRVSVVSLAGLSESNDERLMFVNQLAVALFTWIRKHPAAQAGRVRGLLVVDEARDFIPSVRSTPCKDSLMRLAAQARKYGFGLLLATQNPTDIDHKAAGQCATQFFGRAASPNVVAALKQAIEERGGSASDLTQMEKGQFYFSSSESQKIPTKIRVPMCLSHHPDGKTLSEAEILLRARKPQEG